MVIDLDPQATLRDVAEVREEKGYKPFVSVKGKQHLDTQDIKDADEVLIDIGTAIWKMMKKALTMADRVIVRFLLPRQIFWSTQRFYSVW